MEQLGFLFKMCKESNKSNFTQNKNLHRRIHGDNKVMSNVNVVYLE